MIKITVITECRIDSILPVSVYDEIMKLPGIKKALVVMAKDIDKSAEEDFSGISAILGSAGPNDVILSLDCENEECLKLAEDKLKQIVGGKTGVSGAQTASECFDIPSAKEALPQANICTVSLPSKYAFNEAKAALSNDMNLFIYSYMPEEEELEIKQIAREKGLFVMGPGAGAAVINNLSLGPMSKLRPGRIAVVSDTGSGLHEVAVMIHKLGEGISQAIGTGKNDLSRKIGGIMFQQAIDYLSDDPDTDVLVLILRHCHPDSAKKIFAHLPSNKPVLIFSFGGNTEEIKKTAAYAPQTLEEAAIMAVELARGNRPAERDIVAEDKAALRELAVRERKKLEAGQNYLRALFCGGIHSVEAATLLQDFVPGLHSNTKSGKPSAPETGYRSAENTIIDMGDKAFTKGRPHPIIDPSVLADRMIQEANDPQVGVILFDLFYGHAIHSDPLGAMEDALKEIKRIERDEGRYISVIASLCGTDIEPQNVSEQARRLEEYGVILQPSSAKAALLAGLIVSPQET